MPDYLVTYRPLIESKEGVQASERFGLPPYIDASCRREPDLAHGMPAVTALCRGAMFAPRLEVNDRVVYMTVKRRWDESLDESCWKLVAALHVIHKTLSHGLWSGESNRSGVALRLKLGARVFLGTEAGGTTLKYTEVRPGWRAPADQAPLLHPGENLAV